MNRAQRRKAKKLTKPQTIRWVDLDGNQTSITVANAFNETAKELGLFK